MFFLISKFGFFNIKKGVTDRIVFLIFEVRILSNFSPKKALASNTIGNQENHTHKNMHTNYENLKHDTQITGPQTHNKSETPFRVNWVSKTNNYI